MFQINASLVVLSALPAKITSLIAQIILVLMDITFTITHASQHVYPKLMVILRLGNAKGVILPV
jgi:hypothetical protein